MSEEKKCPKCGARVRRNAIGDGYDHFDGEMWLEAGYAAAAWLYCFEEQLSTRTKELAAEKEENRRLRDGIQQIFEYHASHHRVRLLGGTSVFCQRLLATQAGKDNKK